MKAGNTRTTPAPSITEATGAGSGAAADRQTTGGTSSPLCGPPACRTTARSTSCSSPGSPRRSAAPRTRTRVDGQSTRSAYRARPSIMSSARSAYARRVMRSMVPAAARPGRRLHSICGRNVRPGPAEPRSRPDRCPGQHGTARTEPQAQRVGPETTPIPSRSVDVRERKPVDLPTSAELLEAVHAADAYPVQWLRSGIGAQLLEVVTAHGLGLGRSFPEVVEGRSTTTQFYERRRWHLVPRESPPGG